MTRFSRISAALGLLAAMAAGPAVSGDATKDVAGPTVVELFTSQSCYSCPPAERFLGELAREPGLIALEFHVDYWDDLVYGTAGKWKDPWSDQAYTKRQRGYANRLPGGQSYTPQMVVDGRAFAVGSRKRAVRKLVRDAAADKGGRLHVAVARNTGGFEVTVDGTADPAAVWLVRYLKQETTKVLRGENKGETLTNHNIVTEMTRVGEWRGRPVSLSAPATLAENEGCAVLVQPAGEGPILGAAGCPSGPGTHPIQ